MHDRAGLIYLTDTLESPNQPPAFQAGLLQASLTQERKQAQHVKKSVQVFVCLGNPPYDREQRGPDEEGGRRKGGWVRYGDDHDEHAPEPILEDFLRPVREAGDSGHLKSVYNDYVYFWRWALWKVLDSTDDAGVITFITASSYLRGPGFAGMRRKMREVFDELWIIDLEGGQPRHDGRRRTCSRLRTPVAIAIGFRKGAPDPEHAARVWKTKITGTEQAKLNMRSMRSARSRTWSGGSARADWGAPFYPIGNRPVLQLAVDRDGHLPVAAIGSEGWSHLGDWPGPGMTLERRWAALLAAGPNQRPKLFVNRPTGRKATDVLRTPQPVGGGTAAITALLRRRHHRPPVAAVRVSSARPSAHIFADARVIDRPGPPLVECARTEGRPT